MKNVLHALYFVAHISGGLQRCVDVAFKMNSTSMRRVNAALQYHIRFTAMHCCERALSLLLAQRLLHISLVAIGDLCIKVPLCTVRRIQPNHM